MGATACTTFGGAVLQEASARNIRTANENCSLLFMRPYFFVRSFSKLFNSDINSFTSLKSKYTDANRTYATLSNFLIHLRIPEVLCVIHQRFEFRRRPRTLLTRPQHPLQNFVPVEFLAPPVLLNHHVRNFVNALIRGESLPAFQAFAPPPNQIARAP